MPILTALLLVELDTALLQSQYSLGSGGPSENPKSTAPRAYTSFLLHFFYHDWVQDSAECWVLQILREVSKTRRLHFFQLNCVCCGGQVRTLKGDPQEVLHFPFESQVQTKHVAF